MTLNLVENFNSNNYSKNTVLEDFIQNNFRSMPEKSVHYTAGDTWGFAAYYVHQIQKIRPDVKHVLFNSRISWSAEKFHQTYPEVFLNTSGTLLDSVNFNEYSLYSNIPFKVVPEYRQLSFLGLLHGMTKSDEVRPAKKFNCEVSKKFHWRYRPTLTDFEKFEYSRYFDLQYGTCYFSQGFDYLAVQDLKKARVSFEKAVELSPFSVAYLERLCFLYKKMEDPKFSACDQRLDEIIASSNRQYYTDRPD